MLLRFECENVFCFAQACEFLPIAGSDTRHPDHIAKSGRANAPQALRLSALYGPNGHGKTRLISALSIVDKLITSPSSEPLKEIRPFQLKADLRKKPSRFVVEFRIDNVDYEYGLIATSDRIVQEWLFETEKRQETLLFSREYNATEGTDGSDYTFEFGAKLRSSSSPVSGVAMSDYLRVISTGVEKDRSFLSEAVKRHVNRLSLAFNWFARKLAIVNTEATFANIHKKFLDDESFLKKINGDFCEADTGVESLTVETSIVSETILTSLIPVQSEQMLEDLNALAEHESIQIDGTDGPETVIRKSGEKFEISQLKTIHRADDGIMTFDISEESSGTRRLLDLFPILQLGKESDRVFVVDELDRKLHPLLSYNFVEKFARECMGQLIFTTHTTQLLDLDLLRRDEVWLFQKHADGASALYSLSDFKIRPDLDVRKGYLQGRFGAIPFLGGVSQLGWCTDAD